MDFELSEAHQRIRDATANFAESEIKPHAARWDREQTFPRETIRRLGEQGLLGLSFPERYGGGGADTLSQVLVVEGVSRHSASLGLACAAHLSLATGHIGRFGSDAQQEKFLPDMIKARRLGAWCLTEPGTGSDAAAMRTRARKAGDHYSLTGTKMFITNGSIADVYVVMAVTSHGAGRDGISAFVVERESAGLSSGRRIEKLGLHASDTAEVIFESVAVPKSHRIGEAGDGYWQTLKVLEGARIGIAGFALGIARGAFEESRDYFKERRRSTDISGDLVAIQLMMADMATRIEASWMLICRAAALKDAGRPFGREASMAKLYASEAAMWTTGKAVQIRGAEGYTTDSPVQRYMRDAKLSEIGEGTSEVQRMIIAKSLLRYGLGE